MIYRTDYHIHTTFSDGKNPPEDYLPAAAAAGIREIGFSDHINLYRENQEWCMDPSRIPEYVSYINNLKVNPWKIGVRTSLEVDYFPGAAATISEFLKELELDYVIGSVHYLGDTTVDAGPEFYQGKNINEMYRSFFEIVCQAAESCLFDIIGHADLVRIYNFHPEGDPEPFYNKLASVMSKNDVALEINTNGRNRPLGDFYPDRRFLHTFRKHNVPVCVNSDAHFPSRVGQYFDEAYKLLAEAGYTEMCTFRNRERIMVPAGVF